MCIQADVYRARAKFVKIASKSAADKRADLDLQISLLGEHEITKLATILGAIADKLGVDIKEEAELESITQDVKPEAVLDRIEDTGRRANSR